MSAIDALLSHPTCRAAAWALVHFLWQGTAVALLLAAALAVIPRGQAQARFAAAGSALLAMLALPVLTTMWILGGGRAFPETAHLAASLTGGSPVAGGVLRALGSAAAGPLGDVSSPASGGWLGLVVAVWLAGMVLLSLRNLGSWLGVRRLTRRGVFPFPEEWEALALDLCRRLGVGRPVRFFASRSVSVPTALGWLRPAVLVPVGAFTGLRPDELEALLAHELAHIRRHDYAINLVQTWAETVLFYHPGVWWVSRQMRLERENACDDMAAACCGDPRRVAGALARMEILRASTPSLALGADGGPLLTRIARLAGVPVVRGGGDRRLPGTVVLLAALVLAAVLVAIRPGPGTSDAAYVPRDASGSGSSEFWIASTDRGRSSARGTWEARYRDGHLAFTARVGGSTWGESGDVEKFGIPRAKVEALLAEDPIAIRFPREAGTFEFDGKVDSRRGGIRAHGEFSFEPDPEYVATMRTLGYDAGEVERRQLDLAARDVTTGFVRDLGALGYDRLPLERLVEFRIHGIDVDYVRGIRDAGYPKLPPERLVEFMIHGIDPGYVKGMATAGFPDLPPERIVEFRIHGIDPEYVRGMAASGYRDLPPERVVEFRIHGIDPEYAKGMAEAGFADLPAERLVEFRIHGIDPGYVSGLADAGYPSLPAERVIEFKIHGIDPSYLAGLASVGYPGLPPEKVVEMKIHGVTPESVRRLRDKGLEDLTPDEIIEIHIRGVDAVLRDRGSR